MLRKANGHAVINDSKIFDAEISGNFQHFRGERESDSTQAGAPDD
jgi:hypothetical protein